MRKIAISFSMLVFMISHQTWAAEAEGQLFYKMPSGELVERDVTLEVPARGEGSVVLRGETTELVSVKHFTVKKNGKTTFYVIFKTTKDDGKTVFKIFRGAYLRGSNKAKYYGDIYIKTKYEKGDILDKGNRGTYAGGFWFKVDIEGED